MLHNILSNIYIWLSRFYDRRLGPDVDFAQWVTREELQLAEQDGNQYQPSSLALSRFLKHNRFPAELSVLDIGCGKGRAMYAFAQYPFRAVDGIDLSQPLTDTANRNFALLNVPQCRAICKNALEFEDYAQYDLFYFFNPFPESVFSGVLARIIESRSTRPRDVRLIYMNPACEALILGSGCFTLENVQRSLIHWFEIRTYRMKSAL